MPERTGRACLVSERRGRPALNYATNDTVQPTPAIVCAILSDNYTPKDVYMLRYHA
jgi:hypothetical protein